MFDEMLNFRNESSLATPSNTTTDPRILHAQAIKSPATDIAIYNNLISLYSKSPTNLLSYSLRLFHQIPSPNLVTWTSIISAHSTSFLSLRFFVSMLGHSIIPNQRTLASVLKSCAFLPRCFHFGLSVHSFALKLCLESQPFSGSALVNFYFKYGYPDDGRKVFDEMPDRDEVCYSAMVVGLAQNSRPVDALSVFSEMRCCHVGSNVYNVSGALRAAAEIAAMEPCRIVHGHAVVTGLERNVIVASALVDGYGKAGVIGEARNVFDEHLQIMNIVGWNSLMAAYGQQGDSISAVELFDSMEAVGFVPDEYTFLAILTALYNAGSVVETQKWLLRMKDYNLEPQLQHYTCLIGSMACAGRFIEAERIVATMPFNPDAAVWRILLSASAHHGAIDVAKTMASRLLALDPNDDSAYVITGNILSSAGRWGEVAELRKTMKYRRVKKEGGKSGIEVRGKVHIFLAGDRTHEQTDEIYAKLAELMEEIEKLGYVPVWDEMVYEIGEKEKREGLWYHSEKLALAYGVVSGAAPPGKALRIVKNLRICKDCHEAFKYMSRIVEREIIVRDVNRYHRFLNGVCTCGDFW